MNRSVAPRVGIVILNYNGWRDTIECLESVLRLDYPDFQVVVCDNGSTDDSLAEIERWAIGHRELSNPVPAPLQHLVRPLLSKPVAYVADDLGRELPAGDDVRRATLVLTSADGNLGFAAGSNAAIRYLMARREFQYAWLLNNDVVVSPSSLSELVRAAEGDSGTAAVGGTVLEYSAPETIQFAPGGSMRPWGAPLRPRAAGAPRGSVRETPGPRDFICGASMLVRLSVIPVIGLFDERFFMYWEDADWCFRMRESGFRIGFAPEAEIWHKGGASSVPGSPFSDYHNVRGYLLFARRHNPRTFLAAAAFTLYRSILPKVLRGEWERLGAAVRGYRDAVLSNGR